MFAEIGRDGGGVMGGDGEGVKGRNSRGGLTLPLIWQEKAREGYVDLGSYVTRRGVFTENVTRFGKRYAGDFDFIDALWEGGYSFAWFDRLFARAQVRSEERRVGKEC